LYRVNSSGQFNVPFASYKNPEIFSKHHLERISEILNGHDVNGAKVAPKVKFSSGDFRNITSQAKRGDFVYFDPPYDPLTSTSSFVSYQKEGFSRQDQIDLRDEMVRLTELGVKVILSNSDTSFIRKLYREPKLFKIHSLQVQRAISASSSSRVKVGEVLVRNY
jgi:DNA adenine methylase